MLTTINIYLTFNLNKISLQHYQNFHFFCHLYFHLIIYPTHAMNSWSYTAHCILIYQFLTLHHLIYIYEKKQNIIKISCVSTTKKSSFNYDADTCFLSDNIYDYYNVSQGKVTVPNMDDGEEFQLADVSFQHTIKKKTKKNTNKQHWANH